MKPTVKICLKPKFKIGTMVWTMAPGFSMSDYFQNPSDDKLTCKEVVGFNVQYYKNVCEITGYFLKGGWTATTVGNWYFGSKKEMKNYLKKLAIESYRFGTGYKPNIERFPLTTQERELLKLK